MNNLKPLQLALCSMLLALLFDSASANDPVNIVVQEPQFTFSAGQPLILDREAKLGEHEIDLSLRLRPLLEASNYSKAYEEITAFGGKPSAARHLLAAQLLSINGDYDAAIRSYQAAIKQMPHLTRAHAGIGTLYLLMQRYEPARQSLSKAVSLGVNDAETFAQLGYLNHKLSNPWSAITAYQQALMLEPDNAQSQQGLLAVLIASGQVSSASALISEMLKKDPASVALWQQRANLALQTQNAERALSSLETSIRLGDDNPQNRLAAALLHMRQENFDRASQLLKRNIDDSEIDPASLYPLVIWMIRQNAIDHANSLINAIRGSVLTVPRRQQSLISEMQGRLATAKNDSTRAVAFLSKAIDLDPANGDALVELARLHLSRAEFAQASLMFERAEMIGGHVKSAMLGRAQVAIETRDYAEALRLVRKVQGQFPGSYELDGYIQSLTSLYSAQKSSL